MNHQQQTRIANGIAGFFIFLFLYTAFSKLLDYTAFKAVLSQSPLIGNSAAAAAWCIPAVELTVASLLLAGRSRGLGMVTSLVVMSFFTAYVSYMLLFVPKLPCSCGGIFRRTSWPVHLAFNVVFTGLAFWGAVLCNPKPVQFILHFFTKPRRVNALRNKGNLPKTLEKSRQ